MSSHLINGICWRHFSFDLLWEHLPGVFGNSQLKSLSISTHCLISVCLSLWACHNSTPPRPVDDHTGILTNTNTQLLSEPNAPVLTNRHETCSLRLIDCEAEINGTWFNKINIPGPRETAKISRSQRRQWHWICLTSIPQSNYWKCVLWSREDTCSEDAAFDFLDSLDGSPPLWPRLKYFQHY